MQIILLGFSLRLLVAIWNSFFGPSMGAEGDAITFHLVATGEFGNLDEVKFNGSSIGVSTRKALETAVAKIVKRMIRKGIFDH